MAAVEVRVLGVPSLRVAGAEQVLPHKAFAMLAVLCLTGPQTRGTLAALLWEREQALARQSLRNALMALRRALHPHEALLHNSADRLAADPAALWVDACTLEDAEAEDLRGLWRGPLLEGLDVHDSAAWDDWLAGQEEALAGTHLNRCLHLGEAALQGGDPALAAALAAQALRVTPDSQHAARLLVGAQWADGKEALAHLSATQFCRRFQAEFGADPELLPALPPAAPLLPPVAPLPQPLTALIGRELERRAVLEALLGGRLVTLHGPAGIGKTRLALQTARDVQAAEPGTRVQFVPLDDLRDPAAVLPRVAEALGLRAGLDPLATLLAALHEMPVLLVLDNAEHLLTAADDWPRLLAACPGVRLLVTSREVLRLRAEQVITLDGLEVPAPGCPPALARRADAVRLFTERARQAGAAFAGRGPLDDAALADVRGLCALLGGAPLGLELAAAWTRTRTLPELRRTLEAAVLDLASPHRDARPRHQGLRAALEHSWALLPPEACRDFCALGIFPASFDSAAARAILGAGPARLAELVDRSLLRRDAAGRYHLHPLVRAFAHEKLGLDPARGRRLAERHAAYYRSELECRNSGDGDGTSPPELAYVQAEEANLLALVDHLLAHGPLDGLARVAGPLLWHFTLRGRPADSLRLGRRAAAALRPRGEAADLALATFLNIQGWVEFAFGDLHEALRLYQEASRCADRSGDPLQRTRALSGLGVTQARVGQLVQAVASCQAGMEAAAPLNAVQRYRMQTELAIAWTYAGDVPEAEQAFARAQALLDTGQVDSPLDVFACLSSLGGLRAMAGQPAAAAFAQADHLLRLTGAVGQRPFLLALCALNCALHPAAGSPQQARAYLAEARQLMGERHDPWTESQIEHAGARLALREGDLPAARDHCARAFRAAWPSGNVTSTFLVLPVYARTLAAQGDLPRAAEVVGLLLTHPASNLWTRALAGELLEEWRAAGMQGLEAALERGAGLEVPALFAAQGEAGPS